MLETVNILKKNSRRQKKHEKLPRGQRVNPLCTSDSLVNAFFGKTVKTQMKFHVDPDEMPRDAAFHQGLHYLHR